MAEPETLIKAMEIQDLHLWEKLKEKRIPISFDLEITRRCNMKCRHCYNNLNAGDRNAKAKEMSIKEILSIAQQAVQLGATWCLVTGGEPLLRKDFAEIFLGLKRLGLLVSVFTNATLIQDRHIKLFCDYPPRDIEITVYGVSRQTYEKVTGVDGSFSLFMRNIKKLISNGVKPRLKALAIQSNYHEHKDIAAFCLKNTKDYFRFDPQLHLRFDGNILRNKEIREERLTKEQVIELERVDVNLFKDMQNQNKQTPTKNINTGNNKLFHCEAGNNSFSVSYDGSFKLCTPLCADVNTCNLKTKSLSYAWNTIAPEVRSLRSQRKEYLDTCCSCNIINLCNSCPARAHLETGYLDGLAKYYCEIAQLRAEALKK